MQQIYFATGNQQKMEYAKVAVKDANFSLVQLSQETPEIQGEDYFEIIKDKLERKFELSKGKPVIVSDDMWDIPGLNGFPGPYMKSINYWLSPQNLIDLTKNLQDRRIYFHLNLAYKDNNYEKYFKDTIIGKLLKEPRGESGVSSQKVIALDFDNDLSISEVYDAGSYSASVRLIEHITIWQEFINWHKTI